ncbi:Lipid A export ATP-binding/permease protein MsbA [Desulfosporosinus sp. BG]|nr:Lipid A export ATP-binding/permease protein MsbA [Desulfosporosinus sp. BG]
MVKSNVFQGQRSTIRDADKIMVIGGGEILESGTHDQLMKNQGAYYKMVISQIS